jgi:hypothetical protein
LAISPNNNRLAAATSAGYFAWNLKTGDPLPKPTSLDGMRPDAFAVRAIDFDAAGTHVVLPTMLNRDTVGAWNTSTGIVETWERKRLQKWTGHIVSPDGRFAVFTAVDPDAAPDPRGSRSDSGAELVVVELESGRHLALPLLSGPFAFQPATKEGTFLAARLARDRTLVGIWNLQTEKRIAELRGHAGEVYGIAYSPDANRIATAGRDALRLWDVRLAEEVIELRGHRSFVWSVAFSPDGSCLVSGSGDHTVRVWDTRTRTGRRETSGSSDFAGIAQDH